MFDCSTRKEQEIAGRMSLECRICRQGECVDCLNEDGARISCLTLNL